MKKYIMNSLGHISEIDNKPLTAYELADLMLDVTDCESSEYYQAGIMLRQQADRIAELEKVLAKYAHKILDYQGFK